MSLLKQIDDKGAVMDWCPVPGLSNLVALGTKDSAGGGFDDYGGELEIHMMEFADSQNTSSKLLGKVQAESRFASIAWSRMAHNNEEFPYGIIAGGMLDGHIKVWDVYKLVTLAAAGEDTSESLLASILQHQGSVGGLQFNHNSDMSYLLASGGADGEVFIISLEKPDGPHVFSPAPPPNNIRHTADITKLAWNTQVSHILASCAQNGSCIVWDLKGKKAWCELKEPLGGSFTDLAWNPDQGLNLVTASGDDKNPVLKLWDLRSSTSLPLATLSAHTQGILSVSWCPTDSSLLMSCGKDNKTYLWDLFQLQPVYELPAGGSSGGSDAGFGHGGSSDFGGSLAGQRRYHIAWSVGLPAVISTCSFDRKIQFYSVVGYKSKTGRAPKWLRRPVGATFGFGGKLVSFNNSTVLPSVADPQQQQTRSRLQQRQGIKASVVQVVEDVPLVEACDAFHDALATEDYKSFCENKAATSDNDKDRSVWGLMKVVCFEAEARQELLKYLGYDNDAIAAIGVQFMQEQEMKKNGGRLADADAGSGAPEGQGQEGYAPPPAPPAGAPPLPDGGDAYAAPPPAFANAPPPPPPFGAATGGVDDAMAAMNLFGGGGGAASAADIFGSTSPAADAAATFASDGADAAQPTAEEQAEGSQMQAEDSPVKTHPDASAASASAACVEEQVAEEDAAAADPAPSPPPMHAAEAPVDLDPETHALSIEMATSLMQSRDAEPIVRNALVTGNFNLAVDCCMQAGLYAEALLLAQCAGAELWNRTQDLYFNTMIAKLDRPMLRILQAVTKFELDVFVEQSLLSNWMETLAVLSTYAKTEEFSPLCVVLAERLEAEDYYADAATLCYMCAAKVSKVVEAWTRELQEANAERGHMCTRSLQAFVEKVVMFTKTNTGEDLGSECVAFFAEYAMLLASQGRLDVAAKYLHGDSTIESILRDRLFQATPNKPAGAKCPPFPFTKVQVSSGAAAGGGGATAGGKAGAANANANANANARNGGQGTANKQQQQQQGYSNNNNNSAVNKPAEPAGQPGLPSGWIQLQDPASGRPYYVNQATGSSQWEPPAPSPAPTPAPAPVVEQPKPVQQQQQQQQQQQHQFQQQQQHQQQQQPYQSQRPAVSQFVPNAALQQQKKASPAPASPAAAPAAAPEIDLSVQAPVVAEMTNIVNALVAYCSPAEKRQIAMINDCLKILNAKIARNEVTPDVLAKIEQMVMAILNRNFPAANAIQSDMANTVWTAHKEWLKGAKVIIQLASKK